MRELKFYTPKDFEGDCSPELMADSLNFDEVEALLSEINEIPVVSITDQAELKLLILELKEREQVLLFYFRNNIIYDNFSELFDRPIQQLQKTISTAEARLAILEAKDNLIGPSNVPSKDWSALKDSLIDKEYFEPIDSKFFNALVNGRYHIVPEKSRRSKWGITMQAWHFCNHLGIKPAEFKKYFIVTDKNGNEKPLNKSSSGGVDLGHINDVLFDFDIKHDKGVEKTKGHKKVRT